MWQKKLAFFATLEHGQLLGTNFLPLRTILGLAKQALEGVEVYLIMLILLQKFYPLTLS
jgi:hypothetical protein